MNDRFEDSVDIGGAEQEIAGAEKEHVQERRYTHAAPAAAPSAGKGRKLIVNLLLAGVLAGGVAVGARPLLSMFAQDTAAVPAPQPLAQAQIHSQPEPLSLETASPLVQQMPEGVAAVDPAAASAGLDDLLGAPLPVAQEQQAQDVTQHITAETLPAQPSAADAAPASFDPAAGLALPEEFPQQQPAAVAAATPDALSAEPQEQVLNAQPSAPDLKPEIEALRTEVAGIAAQSTTEAAMLGERIKRLEDNVAALKNGMVTREGIDSLRAAIERLELSAEKRRAAEARKEAAQEVANFRQGKSNAVTKMKKPLTDDELLDDAAAQAPAQAPVQAVQKKPRAPSSAPAVLPPVFSAPPAPAKIWVLKSAKPGMAWIAERGSSQLRMVEVGQIVPGIGKVTSVALDSKGRWVVNGTEGRVNQ